MTSSIPVPVLVPPCPSPATPAAGPAPETPPAFITARQLAAALGVCRRTITTWDQRRIIPSLRVGRVRRYELDQVRAALRAHAQPAAVAETPPPFLPSTNTINCHIEA